tara:strand:- start:282 stop:1034 length:753 start_codon:yes stop_codon:yes gene_type:complete
MSVSDINLKVQDLINSNKYYYSIKKKIKKNYWIKKKDPDGKIRNITKNFKKEKKNFIDNNKSLIKLTKSINFKSICDVGCGPGFLLSVFKRKKSFGIENDKIGIKFASKFGKIFDFDLNDNFKINKKFDIVICNHVIEHVRKPEKLIKNLKKIMKPNGYLIIGTPDFDSAMARKFKNRYRLLHDKTHISLFSYESLMRFFYKNNLKPKKIIFPYFDTTYFNKENILRIFKNNQISPPFYGNFLLVLLKKK